MLNGLQQTRMAISQTGQPLCILAIVLGLVLADGPHFARVGHDHLMAKTPQQTADPGRVRPGFHDHALLRFGFPVPPKRLLAGPHTPFFHDLSVAIQHTVVAESVPQVYPYGPIRSRLPLRFSFSDTLLHWLVSLFAPRVRCGQHHSSFRETGRLIPSEAGLPSDPDGTTEVVPFPKVAPPYKLGSSPTRSVSFSLLKPTLPSCARPGRGGDPIPHA